MKTIKPRNLVAKSLAGPRFRKRVVRDKTIYRRKPRTAKGADK